MSIVLNAKTQELIERRMKELDIPSSDDLVQLALLNFTMPEVCDYDELDDETKAAIDEAEQQEGIPFEEVRDQLMRRYGQK